MDTILVIVTFLSLAMAIGMGLFVAKLLREERRRSDARVAALVELAAEPEIAAVEPRAPQPVIRREAAEIRRPVRSSRPRLEHAPIVELEIRPAQATDERADLFVAPERSSPWMRRLAIIAPMAIIIGIGFFGATARIDSTLEDEAAESQDVAVKTAARPAVPLELLSLRHTQHDGRFTVAGVVQNPRDGASLSRIAATVALFGSDGAQVATARAALDFTTLAPGSESPFVIDVPVAQPVMRYRIGFRGEGGQVIEHVDRRTSADALARK